MLDKRAEYISIKTTILKRSIERVENLFSKRRPMVYFYKVYPRIRKRGSCRRFRDSYEFDFHWL